MEELHFGDYRLFDYASRTQCHPIISMNVVSNTAILKPYMEMWKLLLGMVTGN
jgi:hypothetical protein